MANFNKVILAGNLTREPELKYTPSQMAVCEFGMAVNRKYKGGDGQQKEDVCFVDCQAWGKTGEIINQYMNKGKPILVEGRLSYDSWEGKDGQKRSRLRVTVENFQFIGGAPDEQGGGQRQAPPQRQQQAPPQPQGGHDYPAPPRSSYEPAQPPRSSYEPAGGYAPDPTAPGGDRIPFAP